VDTSEITRGRLREFRYERVPGVSLMHLAGGAVARIGEQVGNTTSWCHDDGCASPCEPATGSASTYVF
jgi:hypothetical protein